MRRWTETLSRAKNILQVSNPFCGREKEKKKSSSFRLCDHSFLATVAHFVQGEMGRKMTFPVRGVPSILPVLEIPDCYKRSEGRTRKEKKRIIFFSHVSFVPFRDWEEMYSSVSKKGIRLSFPLTTTNVVGCTYNTVFVSLPHLRVEK